MQELAALKAQEAPQLLRRSAQYAWSNRWWSLVSTGVQRAIAEALLRDAGSDLQTSVPIAEAPPLADVLLQ